MTTTLYPGYAPMEAKLVDELPDEGGWQFEPKWDGFRCLAFRRSGAVTLMSKSSKPLGRFFPEVAALVAGLPGGDLVLDGELILPRGYVLSFEALQARLHPAQSRIDKLSRETPAQFMAFDLLQAGRVLANEPLSQRRARLEAFLSKANQPALLLSPCSTNRKVALTWLARSGGALDGVVAKRLADVYQPGERAMLKVKQHRTADCVVGGFRYERGGREVASLLLGLYDDAGRLDHVGFTSAIATVDRPALTKQLEALAGEGFSGKAPGGPSRWSTERSADWQPLRPELVVEVRYDQVTAGRFRHGTRLLRWRPDKAPAACTRDQLVQELRPSELAEVIV
ncbi:ATP-dependent DNA ligase [Sphingomonas guangdongensis]|uniref:DNA ligase (ATP) n=1 Tax=Sphingomonas guangdongensis TaxID=1141890 RepID=A0A285QXJ2_9SPHN|nr:ATP-dependent DNA ligase [Sphingomonas guangdongensis]SOB86633.1 ATP-dependent DNA ligase [Sphingomonas guangdongensis]